MTRTIINILFLLPFFANAQFRLKVKAINLEDHSEISHVQFSLGGSGNIDFGITESSLLDVKQLADTLFFRHGNFKFEDQPLLNHEYAVIDNVIIVRAYGRPWKKNEININLNIAKSKKIKNDSVRIEYFHDGPNAIISFDPPLEVKKKKSVKVNPFVRAYDDLMDGQFVMTYNHTQKKVPFQKANWTQTVCLSPPKKINSNERELSILSSYFTLIKDSRMERKKLERTHEREVDSLQREIDELNREIDRLNGIPVAYRPFYPAPIEEEAVEEIFFYVENNAMPTGGYEQFKSDVKAIIGDMRTKFSGNITIEVIVQKDGKIRTKVLHAAEDKSHVTQRLRYHLNQQRWEPAHSSGRALETSTIISIDIDASK